MARSRGRVRVRISGMSRLRSRLEDLPEELIDACKTAIKESAEAVRAETARTVPVDASGRDNHHLKDHVAVRYEDDGLTAEVGWFDPASYYAAFLEHGTRRAPARPSLHPALEAEKARLRGRISDEVRRAIG